MHKIIICKVNCNKKDTQNTQPILSHYIFLPHPRHHFCTAIYDQDCQKLRTRCTVSGSLPLLALASYPGSWNSWVRHMVELTSGVFTAAIREVWCVKYFLLVFKAVGRILLKILGHN